MRGDCHIHMDELSRFLSGRAERGASEPALVGTELLWHPASSAALFRRQCGRPRALCAPGSRPAEGPCSSVRGGIPHSQLWSAAPRLWGRASDGKEDDNTTQWGANFAERFHRSTGEYWLLNHLGKERSDNWVFRDLQICYPFKAFWHMHNSGGKEWEPDWL